MRRKLLPLASAGLCVALAAPVSAPAFADEYILAPARPNRLVLVNTDKKKVEKVIEIEGAGPAPIVPVVAPDKRTAYALANGTESVFKIDLDSGKTVGRADMSHDNERVKGLFGMDISPDGKTLVVYQSPVKKELSHFEPQPTRLAFYDTETMKLKHTQEAPRQITLLMYSEDGKKIFGAGREMHVFDGETGKKIDEMPIQSWDVDARNKPDVLAIWSQHENSGMMTIPFYSNLKGKAEDDPEAWKTGLLTLDRKTGKMKMRDVENMDVFYFSTASSPDHKRAFGAYNVLQSFDLETGKPIKRVPLPHSYYSVNVSKDGKTVWLGGALSDLAAYDTETLERKGQVDLPDGTSMSLGSVRMFSRDN
ncbi:quinohemoprotein amine dehydrogenase subunit beta [Xanthobacter sp. TB0136]|uniref:quinohemoprotein amine dehydrogenase subunit beta n=1 Tax=Xanthobacter sp. TB0136 TaxID=3459177 RepID=UPI0040393262